MKILLTLFLFVLVSCGQVKNEYVYKPHPIHSSIVGSYLKNSRGYVQRMNIPSNRVVINNKNYYPKNRYSIPARRNIPKGYYKRQPNSNKYNRPIYNNGRLKYNRAPLNYNNRPSYKKVYERSAR